LFGRATKDVTAVLRKKAGSSASCSSLKTEFLAPLLPTVTDFPRETKLIPYKNVSGGAAEN